MRSASSGVFRTLRQKLNFVAVVASLAVVATSIITVAAPAPVFAADTDSAAVSVTKKVMDGGTPVDNLAIPYETASSEQRTIQYQVIAGCDNADCTDFSVVDSLPKQFAQFNLKSVTARQGTSTLPVTVDNCAVGGALGESCVLTASVAELPAGETITLDITLTIPLGLTPQSAGVGAPVTNTVVVNADNAIDPANDSAIVTINVAEELAAQVTKTWADSVTGRDSQQFADGKKSSVTLKGANASNVAIQKLVIQDPQTAADGETELASSNPFKRFEFAGLGQVDLPEGAQNVQVDVYYLGDSGYEWVSGTPGSAAELPATVTDNAKIGGIRFTFTSDSDSMNPGSNSTMKFDLKQRSGQEFIPGDTVQYANTASGVVSTSTKTSTPVDSTAKFTVEGIRVDVTATKNIEQTKIDAGQSFQATLGATNKSGAPLNSLTITEPSSLAAQTPSASFFNDNVNFTGFNSWVAPQGAQSATIKWWVEGATGLQSLPPISITPVTNAPNLPAGIDPQKIRGFSVTFTGEVPDEAQATIGISGTTTESVLQSNEAAKDLDNTVAVTGTNLAGTTTSTDNDTIKVQQASVSVATNKTLSPKVVTPGNPVVAKLDTTLTATSEVAVSKDLEIADTWTGAEKNYWNAFNATKVVFTGLPSAGTSAKVFANVGTVDVPDWQEVGTVAAGTSSFPASVTIPDPANTIGVKVEYHTDEVSGFPVVSNFSPNVMFEARTKLRTPLADGTEDTDNVTSGNSAAQQPTDYSNVINVKAQSTTQSGSPLPDSTASDGDNSGIITYPAGQGSLHASKKWVQSVGSSANADPVIAQSGQKRFTRQGWGVATSGISPVTLTDHGGLETDVSKTVFNAFNLTRIHPTTLAQDPALKWDTITSVALINSAGVRTVVAPPGGAWQNADGSFKGYALTTQQSESTVGVEVVVDENTARRNSNWAAVSPDLSAPKTGEGVTSTGLDRPIWFEWQLRNVKRDGTATNKWVTGSEVYNISGSEGAVRNTLRVSSSATVYREESADITIVNAELNVGVHKSTAPNANGKDAPLLVVPQHGDAPQANYPTFNYTVKAWNASQARASYIRVTDPNLCTVLVDCLEENTTTGAQADPFDGATYSSVSPFERFNITKLNFTYAGQPIDESKSTVTLWHPSRATSTSEMTIATARSLSAADLVDVVGVSVLYQSSSPEISGGQIATGSQNSNALIMTMSMQVREYLRSAPTTPVSAPQNGNDLTVGNGTYAQTFDPISQGATKRTGSSDNADVLLRQAHLEVTAAKTVSSVDNPTDEVREPLPGEAVNVTLSATSGKSTAPALTASIEDDTEEFWSAFRLDALTSLVVPQGANQVRLSALVADEWLSGAWTTGTGTLSGSSVHALLPPSVELVSVEGLKVEFKRQDGNHFSATVPAQAWTSNLKFVVKVRDDQPFPAVIRNTVTTGATHVSLPDATASANASIKLTLGESRLDVVKTPETDKVFGGEPFAWKLTFKNSGSSYLDIQDIVEGLPKDLAWDQGEVSATSPQSHIPADDLKVKSFDASATDYSAAGNVVLGWDEPVRFAPGDSMTITIKTIMRLGADVANQQTNTFTVKTAQDLVSCTNTSGNGQGTLSGLGAKECGTKNSVTTFTGASLMTQKFVQGKPEGSLVTGAVNKSKPTQTCVPTGDRWFSGNCTPFTTVGATDTWKLRALNNGTVSYNKVTFVESLPKVGDLGFGVNSSRGSEFTPVFKAPAHNTFAMTAPAGTTMSWEVTTNLSSCTGSNWKDSATTCPSATWIPSASFTGDWATVEGIRMTFDLSQTSSRTLAPGESIEVIVETENLPNRSAGAVSVTQGVADQVAWNQFGATVVTTGGQTISRAPAKVGVRTLSGSLEIAKELDGDASGDFASDLAYEFELACTVNGANVLFSGSTTKSVLVAAGESTVVAGLPLGSSCTVLETQSHGSTSTDVSTAGPIAIDVAGTATDPIPVGQSVTFTNSYDYGSLTVSKHITANDSVGAKYGPFTFELTCTAFNGTAIAPITFTLSDVGNGVLEWTAPADTLPVNASCELTETTTGNANSVTFTVDGEAVTATNNSIDVTIGSDTEVDATNTFTHGKLSVTKAATGTGAGDFGNETFTVEAVCTYNGVTVYEGEVSLKKSETKVFQHNGSPVLLPNGAVCDLTESRTGGANGTSVDGETGRTAQVQIVGGANATTAADNDFDVENVFNTGSVQLNKNVTGAGADRYGVDSYTVQLVCTYNVDGETKNVMWDGTKVVPQGTEGALPFINIALLRENSFTATAYGIIQGADCEIVSEPVTGGAHETEFSDSITIAAPGATQVPTLTATNTFNTGSIAVQKVETGAGVARFGGSDYTVELACTYQADGATQRITFAGEDTLAITLTADDDYRAVIADLYVGADCWIVAETATGGANEIEFSVSEAAPLTVTETEDPQDAQTITVTNSFYTGAVTVNKDVVGDGAQRFGQNEFTVRLQCTYDIDGVATNVMWGENSFIDIVLNPDNGYTHTESNLIEGADCWVESEVQTGGSNVQDLGEHVIVVGDNLGDGDPQEPVSITVTNTFNTASVSIRKNEVGAAAGRFGTQTYTVLLACTYDVNGTATDVLWDGQRTLEVLLGPDNNYTHVEQGLLVGARCDVVEETVTGGANEVDLGQPVIVTDASDQAPQIEVTNTFNTAEVTINKVIEGKGSAQYGAGPFTAQLQCTYDKDGVPTFITWDGSDVLDVELTAENGYSVLVTNLIEGASCEIVSENADGGATEKSLGDKVMVVAPKDLPDDSSGSGEGSGGEDGSQGEGAGEGSGDGEPADGESGESGSSTTDEPAQSAAGTITVTNTFKVGTLSVSKSLSGEGAERYGTDQSFEVSAQCVYQDETIYVSTVVIKGGETQYFLDAEGNQVQLPANTNCVLEETLTGGANSNTITNEGNIFIAVSEDATVASENLVDVDNMFTVGQVEVHKDVVGSGADLNKGKTYTVILECTYLRDGEATPITWDGLSTLELVLSPDNDYTQVITNLIVGANCAVVEETQDGGATSTDLGSAVTIAEESQTITVTNTFEVGTVTVTKAFDGKFAQQGERFSYEFEIQCTYQDARVLWDNQDTYRVTVGSETNFQGLVPNVPFGAECEVVKESDAHGATATDLGEPTVVEDAEGAQLIITNTFNTSLDTDGNGGGLPQTGAQVAGSILTALVLLAGGYVLMAVGRRRKAEQHY